MAKTGGKAKQPTRRATAKAPPKVVPTCEIPGHPEDFSWEELKEHNLGLWRDINFARGMIRHTKAKAEIAALQERIDDLERDIDDKHFSAPMSMKELEKYTRLDYSKLKRHCDEKRGVREHVSGNLFRFDTRDPLFKELPLKMSEKTRPPRKPRGRHKPKIE